MHSATIEHFKEICPVCKTVHDIEFESCFNGHIHYLCGTCPNCNYKINFRDSIITSGTQVDKKISGQNLESKI